MKSALLNIFLLAVLIGSYQAAISQSNNIPFFSFYDLEGNVFTSEKVSTEMPTMIMLFDPYCDHCSQQASWIVEQESNFKDVQLIFVTIEPETEAIASFKEKHFGKSGLKHVHFLQDRDFAFETYFGYSDDAINIYLYKPGQRRPKYFGEEQEASTLLKFL